MLRGVPGSFEWDEIPFRYFLGISVPSSPEISALPAAMRGCTQICCCDALVLRSFRDEEPDDERRRKILLIPVAWGTVLIELMEEGWQKYVVEQ